MNFQPRLQFSAQTSKIQGNEQQRFVALVNPVRRAVRACRSARLGRGGGMQWVARVQRLRLGRRG
ncbi:hypothetical protein BZL29_8332 [Mycobacterium kansasii]|uniref:Uncharacterized protein n=1 Tax=Mycobacterium kansasii TaxID=1768 RepID=A0A1V3WAL2_MYCKA|nr:hypothetical protein BZL29_8332 [Mycobacterium kansasii]